MAFYELLLIALLPSGMVVLVTYFLVKSTTERELYQRKIEAKSIERKQLIPLKLQAAERMVLFIERLTPTSLMMRVNQQNTSSRALQMAILKMVREEFEHNFSQQIYVSEATWNLVKNAKDEVLGLLNAMAGKLSADATSNDLVREMLSADANKYYPSIEKAKKLLRAEVNSI